MRIDGIIKKERFYCYVMEARGDELQEICLFLN